MQGRAVRLVPSADGRRVDTESQHTTERLRVAVQSSLDERVLLLFQSRGRCQALDIGPASQAECRRQRQRSTSLKETLGCSEVAVVDCSITVRPETALVDISAIHRGAGVKQHINE